MLAHHPTTKQPIRIVKTKTNVSTDTKTLVWIRKTFKPSRLWVRWNCIISEPECATYVCGPYNMIAVVLTVESTVDQWKTVFPTIFHSTSETILVGPSAIIDTFAAAGLRSDQTLLVEDLYDTYPYLGEPVNASDPIEKTIVSIAHILRMNKIAWNVSSDTASQFGVAAQLAAWGKACCSGTLPLIKNLTNTQDDSCIPHTWLITQYFVHNSGRRHREIRKCLDNNLACGWVDHILLLNEKEYTDLPADPKIKTAIIGHRLTYYDVFKAIKEKVPEGDYVIFANADIWLNDTIRKIYSIGLEEKRLFCALLRWEDNGTAKPSIFGPRADSQDTWIVARNNIDFDLSEEEFGFPFGKPGCDNVITLLMFRKRFVVVNPAFTIRTMHLHSSQVRNYDPKDVLYRPHYMHTEPTHIQPFSAVTDMATSSYKPPASVGAYWDSNRLGRSFARPILSTDPNGAATICSMLKRNDRREKIPWIYVAADANLWTPPPQAAPLYNIRGGCFVSSSGLISTFRDILVGTHSEWLEGWSAAGISMLSTCIHVPRLIACEYDEKCNTSLSKWVLHYLPRALAIRDAVEHGGGALPEFIVPSLPDIGAFLNDCKWKGADEKGNITIVPHMKDANYYADEVWAVPPIKEHSQVTAEDVDMLRTLLPSDHVRSEKSVAVFCVDDAETQICTRSWAESVAENIFHTGWIIRYVSATDLPSVRRKAFADASWIFGAGDALEWMWLAAPGTTVMEFMRDTDTIGSNIHLAGAAGLRYILSTVKREPIVHQRQNALLDVSAAIHKFGFTAALNAITKNPSAKPTIIIPAGAARTGIWDHDDTGFRTMAEIWNERGFVNLERSEETGYCWWGGAGEVLLYDRPTLRWWDTSAPPTYQMAMFANTAPPGPGPHLLKQSIWGYWGRHPRELENVASRVENMRGYSSRSISSVFLGKVENGVQHAHRCATDWSNSVELFSMPVDSSGKPYPYSQKEYLETLCKSRYGLCLPGSGQKCNREIEYFCCGVVPIITPGVDIKGYLVPPVEGVHYFSAKTPDDVQKIVKETAAEKWATMSAAGREWWRTYASAEGLFRLTWARIEQCRPYFNVGIPQKFII